MTKLFYFLFLTLFILTVNSRLLPKNDRQVKPKLNEFTVVGSEKFGAKEIQGWFGFRKDEFISKEIVRDRGRQVLEHLKDRGYFFAKFYSVLFNYKRDSLTVDVTVRIDEGELVRVQKLTLKGMEGKLKNLKERLQTKPEKIFQPKNLQQDIDFIIQNYEQQGYPYCQVNIKELRLEKSGLEIELEIEPGPLVTISEIEIHGNKETKNFVILREIGIEKGEIYDQKKINKINPRLNKLGYFKWLNPPKLVWLNDGNGKLIIELAEGNSNRFDGVIGYNPGTGTSSGFVTGLLDFSFGNLFGTGRQIDAHWERRTEKTQVLRFGYLEPWVAGLPLNLGFNFEQLIQDTSYVQRNLELNLRFLFNENLSFFSKLTKRNVSPDSLGAIVFGIPRSSSLNAAVGLTFDTLDDFFNPIKGVHYQTFFEWGRKNIDGSESVQEQNSVNQTRAAIDFENYFSIFHHQIIAIALHGRETKSDERPVPITEQYRFGGTKTLRGYREEQFRGSRIAWANIEYRYLLGRRSRVFLFMDIGYFFREVLFDNDFKKIQEGNIGYGIGFRMDTKLGFFGIDYGLGEGDGLSSGKVHIGLTNEF